jgi:hypothetical protein
LDPYKNPRMVRACPDGLHSSQPPPCSDRFKGLWRLLAGALLPALLAMGVMHPWVWSRLLRMGATAHGPINYGDDFSVRRPRSNAFFVLILLLSAFPARPAAYSHHPHIASQVRHTPAPSPPTSSPAPTTSRSSRASPPDRRRRRRHRRPLRRRGSVFWASLRRSKLCGLLCMCVV